MLDVDEGNLYKFVIEDEDDGVVVVADSAGSVAVAGVIGDVSIVQVIICALYDWRLVMY